MLQNLNTHSLLEALQKKVNEKNVEHDDLISKLDLQASKTLETLTKSIKTLEETDANAAKRLDSLTDSIKKLQDADEKAGKRLDALTSGAQDFKKALDEQLEFFKQKFETL